MSDTNMPLLIGLVCVGVLVVCSVGLLALVWLEVRDSRAQARRDAAVVAESSRPFPGDSPDDWAAWEQEHAEYLSRCNHPSNHRRPL